MSSSHKKVLLRRFTGETLPGYLPLSTFVRNKSVDLLDLSGRVISIAVSDIKYICYVRDFNLSDTSNPERLTRRTFLARPRTEGLWLRLTFRSSSSTSDQLEGLAPTDATLLDDLLNDAGLFLIPPDTRSNTQRIYVPRTSITDLQLIAVITSPSRRKPLPAASVPTMQEDLFDTMIPPNTRPN
ncbi:MAG: hypothetical protein JWQ42_1234 [Edaphobacter sp.]|nr:hypothetical protein [Edaphobacter sp.]